MSGVEYRITNFPSNPAQRGYPSTIGYACCSDTENNIFIADPFREKSRLEEEIHVEGDMQKDQQEDDATQETVVRV